MIEKPKKILSRKTSTAKSRKTKTAPIHASDVSTDSFADEVKVDKLCFVRGGSN